MIKTLNDTHTYIRPTDNKNSNSRIKWISEKLISFSRADFDMSYELLHQILIENWGIKELLWQLYKARNLAKVQNIGEHAYSYSKLKKYLFFLQKYNPGTMIKIQTDIITKK